MYLEQQIHVAMFVYIKLYVATAHNLGMKRLRKLDDKKFSILKKGIGI